LIAPGPLILSPNYYHYYSGHQKSVSKTSPCSAEQLLCDDSSI